jgi:hypothetical protein
MPGRGPRRPDRLEPGQWDGEEAARRRPADDRDEAVGRAGDRDPGRRADYDTEQGLTPEDREAIGGGGDRGGSYAPTAEEATGRKRRGGDARDGPGAWFGRPPSSPKPRRSPSGRQPKK